MQLTRHKIKDIAKTSSGGTPTSTNREYYENGTIPWINSGELAQPFITKPQKYITELGYNNSSAKLFPKNDTILLAMYGATAGKASLLQIDACTNQAICAIMPDKKIVDPLFLKYKLDTMYAYLVGLSTGSARDNLSQTGIGEIVVDLPSLDEQKSIASVLSNLDRKIALNRQINANLEALARQLYDYWFVQFDFPDASGKPYKSSGGKMVYNPQLKREIPEGWNVCKLEDFILANNTGDWGIDAITDGYFKVGCVRGADILALTDLPIRYIKNEEKLLSEHDIIIEVSGGSPTQATGRSAYVTKGVIERNGRKITCSNFCHAFTLKDIRKAPFFYYSWRLLYDNNNMFNYEGKTSGLKNFMTEMFLKNYWIDVPQHLANDFFDKVSVWFALIDANIAENVSLTRQRDELLPLLMNGQVTVE